MTSSQLLAESLFALLDAKREVDDIGGPSEAVSGLSCVFTSVREISRRYLDACDAYRAAAVACVREELSAEGRLLESI